MKTINLTIDMKNSYLKLKYAFYIFTLLSVFVLAPSLARAFDNKDYNNNLQIINKEGSKILGNFKVKIANNSNAQEVGLMFVSDLPKDHGLLLEFKKEKIVHMWMKNTLISLDMIFIDKNDEIVHFYNSAVPLSLDRISSKYKSKRVLEVRAGSIKRLGIDIGDTIKLF